MQVASGCFGLGCFGLTWSAAKSAISPRCRSLCHARRFAALRAKPGCHPGPRAEKTLQQPLHREIGVQFWKIQTLSGRAYLDLIELIRCCSLQSLCIFGRESDVETGI